MRACTKTNAPTAHALPDLHKASGFHREGARNAKGASRKGGVDLTQEIIVATGDQHVTSRSSGSATSAAPTVSNETFLVDGASYSFNPSETSDLKCARFSSRQPPYSNPLLFNPQSFSPR